MWTPYVYNCKTWNSQRALICLSLPLAHLHAAFWSINPSNYIPMTVAQRGSTTTLPHTPTHPPPITVTPSPPPNAHTPSPHHHTAHHPAYHPAYIIKTLPHSSSPHHHTSSLPHHRHPQSPRLPTTTHQTLNSTHYSPPPHYFHISFQDNEVKSTICNQLKRK